MHTGWFLILRRIAFFNTNSYFKIKLINLYYYYYLQNKNYNTVFGAGRYFSLSIETQIFHTYNKSLNAKFNCWIYIKKSNSPQKLKKNGRRACSNFIILNWYIFEPFCSMLDFYLQWHNMCSFDNHC